MQWMAMLVLLAAGIPASPVSASSGVVGDWMTPTQSVIRIYPCGSAVCAKIVKLAKDSPVRIDSENPERNLRNRPLCGLDIGTGFRQVDAAHLDNGHLYDPKSGHTYSGTIVANGDQLNLRGYIGLSIFGRSETWHRTAEADAASCN